MSGTNFLKVGQVANLLSVSCRVVAKWFDNGELKGYRLPGPKGERRIYRASFDDFIKRHAIPQPIDGSEPAIAIDSRANDGQALARIKVQGFAMVCS
jgi:excisionase family DNA binding protein